MNVLYYIAKYKIDTKIAFCAKFDLLYNESQKRKTNNFTLHYVFLSTLQNKLNRNKRFSNAVID